MGYCSFEDLEVWKDACRLAVDVYGVFRECRDFSFRDQIQRASISIPSNIAEGAERGSNKEFIRFIHIAKGSAGELRTQLYIAEKVDPISQEDRKRLCADLVSISRRLHALAQSLAV